MEKVESLEELLGRYPGLMSSSIEIAAQALAQATVAAADVAAREQQRTDNAGRSGVCRAKLGRSAGATALDGKGGGIGDSEARTASSCTSLARSNARGDSDTQQSTGNEVPSRRRWLTSEHLQQLQRQGVRFTKGKFTEDENAAIEQMVDGFVEGHGLTRQELYAHLFQRKNRDMKGKQLRKRFWPAAQEVLPTRQIQAVYHHVRRKYHPHNYQGAWKAGEDGELQRLVDEHGPCWETIAERLGRMGTNCRDRWRYIRGTHRSLGSTEDRSGNRSGDRRG